jgi:hypothetical protein
VENEEVGRWATEDNSTEVAGILEDLTMTFHRHWLSGTNANYLPVAMVL